MNKLVFVFLLLLSGCLNDIETPKNENITTESIPDKEESVEENVLLEFDESELEFFDKVSIYGERYEVYIVEDYDTATREILSFHFGDTTYSFYRNTIFVLDDVYIAVEDYIGGDDTVYTLHQLVDGGVPIEFTYEVNELEWSFVKVYNTVSGVTMLSEFEVYQEGVQSIRKRISNNTDSIIGYGNPFQLHKLVNGSWRAAERNDGINRGFTLLGYSLENVELWKNYNVNMFTFFMSEGEYRIVSDFHYMNEGYGRNNFVSYFEVGKTPVKRDLDVLNQDGYYFMDNDIGIAMLMESTWEDAIITKSEIDSNNPLYSVYYAIDEDAYEYRIENKHSELGFQDIVFIVNNPGTWNNSSVIATIIGGDWDIFPDRIRPARSILFWDNYYYDEARYDYQYLLDLINSIESY